MQAHYIYITMLDDVRRHDITIAVLEVICIAHCIAHLYALYTLDSTKECGSGELLSDVVATLTYKLTF